LLALCTGRQILLESQSKKKVRLARDMHDAAKRAIDLNPKDDAAHFMLARWHNDIASLPSFLKTLVRFIYGSSLKGTFQNAIESAQTAISLNPTNLVNKVELGRAYTGLGDLDRAKAVYKEVVSMHLEVQDVNSALYRQLAVDDIERMENGVQVGSLARPWWAVGG
jgi:tetratricopeptide (TPR) repeat protein